jgi:cbb3-type cytochrome oxidase subunit 3
MIKAVLEHIGGVGLYGVISVCLFFVVFLGVLVRVARMKRAHAEAIAALPLNDGETDPPPTAPNHERTDERNA